MRVRNVHERLIAAPPVRVGALLDRLATKDDPLWPYENWPRMRLDPGLQVDAVGGHGPVRYSVERHEPGRLVVFRFRAPRGFDGTHRYEVVPQGEDSLLRHVLEMRAHGPALLSWPLVFRPLHDALIEDSLDKAARRFGAPTKARWSFYVRLLRRILRLR